MPPFENDRYALAGLLFAKSFKQLIELGDIGSFDGDQLIPYLNTSLGCRAIPHDLGDHRLGIDVLSYEPKIASESRWSFADILAIDDGIKSVWRMLLPIQSDPTGHAWR